MSFRSTTKGPAVVNLDGPNGNAFVLLAYARTWSRQLGLDEKKIYSEMTSGDYIHLLSVLDNYFGHIVVFETDNPEYLKIFS